MRSIKARNNLSPHLFAHAFKQKSAITINLGNLDCRSLYINIPLRRNSVTTVTLRSSTAPTTNSNSHTYYDTYTDRVPPSGVTAMVLAVEFAGTQLITADSRAV
ncbi:hypothetical protein ACFPU0_14565 [Pseudomonas sp. GCM10022186]|uniref:hypothetical protein n=1 Tax=Pseudomonas sp. GCM10022186 TaxID=3252650 RepID=UPI00361EE73A